MQNKVRQPKKFPQCGGFNHLEIFVLPGNIWGKFSPPALICWQFVLVCPRWPKIACMGRRRRRATVIIWTLAHYAVTTVWPRRGQRPHHAAASRACVLRCFPLRFQTGFQNVDMNFFFIKNKKRERKEANIAVKVWHCQCLVSVSLISKHAGIECPCSHLGI